MLGILAFRSGITTSLLPVAYADLTRGNQASARGRRRRGPVTSRAVSVMDDVGNDDLTYLISPRTCASPIFPVR